MATWEPVAECPRQKALRWDVICGFQEMNEIQTEGTEEGGCGKVGVVGGGPAPGGLVECGKKINLFSEPWKSTGGY